MYGEVQGPINKEPDEKLNPSNTSSSSSGIRRLYVTDNLLIVVVTSATSKTSRKMNVPFCHQTHDFNNNSTLISKFSEHEPKEDERNEFLLNEKHVDVEEEEDELERQHEQDKYEKRHSFQDLSNNRSSELSSNANSTQSRSTHSSSVSPTRNHSFKLYLLLFILNLLYVLFTLKLSQILHILVFILIDLISCPFVYYFSVFVYLVYSLSNIVLALEQQGVSSANRLGLSKNEENLVESERTSMKRVDCNENEESDHFFFVYSFQQTFKLIKRKDNGQTA